MLLFYLNKLNKKSLSLIIFENYLSITSPAISKLSKYFNSSSIPVQMEKLKNKYCKIKIMIKSIVDE